MWSQTTAASAALILVVHLCGSLYADHLGIYDSLLSQNDVGTTNHEERQGSGFFDEYRRYEEIVKLLKELAARFPKNCRYESFGKSIEGRHLPALSISQNSKVPGRKVVYIQSGAHAREWVGPPTVLYLANEILTNMKNYQKILSDTELYLVPMVNPDGYEYAHTSNRGWRKNRRVNSKCIGVDLNRNYNNHWNTTGVSQNPCYDTYPGTGPASEPETYAVSRYLEKNHKRVKVALDVHCHGSLLLYPYGYTNGVNATTHKLLKSVGDRVALAIAKYRGTQYKVMASGSWYETSGGFEDFAYGLGIPLSYVIELPGKSFQMPESEIIPIGKETFAGFIEFIKEAQNV